MREIRAGASTATNPLLGDVLVVLAQLFAASQFIVEEKYLAKYEVPALLAVGLEVSARPASALLVAVPETACGPSLWWQPRAWGPWPLANADCTLPLVNILQYSLQDSDDFVPGQPAVAGLSGCYHRGNSGTCVLRAGVLGPGHQHGRAAGAGAGQGRQRASPGQPAGGAGANRGVLAASAQHRGLHHLHRLLQLLRGALHYTCQSSGMLVPLLQRKHLHPCAAVETEVLLSRSRSRRS